MAKDYIDREAAVAALLGDETVHIPTLMFSQKRIEAVPAADVVEVRRGKWLHHPDSNVREFDVCSACGTGCKRREYGKMSNGREWVTEWNYPYCPNCGAKMEGE